MKVKKSFFIAFLLSFTISSYSKDTLINISPYSFGEINIQYSTNSNTDFNYWFEDTITFSSGTKITFMEANHLYTSVYVGTGGMVFIDTISSVDYKFNTSLTKEELSLNPQLGEYSLTTGNPDTIWNIALNFPDSLAICDTVVYGNIDADVKFFKAKILYEIIIENSEWWPHTTGTDNFNSIIYVKSLNNIHIKLQIYKFLIVNIGDEDHTIPKSITLLWATDSLGNGIFKHDPTSNKINTTNKIEPQTKRVFISNLNGIPYLYLHLSNILDTDNELKIDIYNLKGRKILQKRTKSFKPINLSQFHSGVYLIHITSYFR